MHGGLDVVESFRVASGNKRGEDSRDKWEEESESLVDEK